MKISKHPRELTDSDVDDLLADFDRATDHRVVDGSLLTELRAAASARCEADVRIEEAVQRAHSAGLSWGIIGAQLGMTRQGARQRFSRTVQS